MSVKQKAKVLEADVKSAVLNHLNDKGELSQHSTIINELTLNKFSRRVDLAILDKGRAYAFEIKSASDSLERLGGQVQEYLNYFDKVIIVAAPKHIDKILSLVPKNVGVWEIRGNKIALLQRGRIVQINSLPNTIALLKANELYQLSNRLRLEIDSSARKHLEDALISLAEFNKTIREFFLQCLKNRYSETSRVFLDRLAQGAVVPEDIALLSRTRVQREREALWKIEQERFWESFPKQRDCYLEEADISFGEAPSNIRKLIAA